MAYEQGIPYGNAFLVETPKFDAARQQLLNEQMQRRAFQQKDAINVENQLAHQFSRVRSVDMPDVMTSYQNAKNLKKQLLFDPRIYNNPQAYADLNDKYNSALAETFQKADQSAQYKQQGHDLFTSYRAHPDRYADNFGGLMTAYNTTPMSKLEDHPLGDLSNPDTYMYKGSNTDFSAIDKAARGNVKPLPDLEEPFGENNLQIKITPFTGGNTPDQYYRSMVMSLGKRGAGRDASAQWQHIIATTPEFIDHVNQEYNKITPEQWKRWTGSETPPDINPDPTSDAEKFAAFQAKAYAIANLPKAGTSRFVNNQENLLNAKSAEREKLQQNTFKQQKIMQNIRNNQAIGRIQLHRLYAQQDAAGQNALVDQHFNDEFDEAKKQQPLSIPTDSGKPLVGFKYEPMDAIAKEFYGKDDKGHPIKPNGGYLISPDGKTVTGVFLKAGPDGKTPVIDDTKTIQKSVDTELKPVFKAFATPKTKVVPNGVVVPPKPKVPVSGVHKFEVDNIGVK